MSICVFLNSRSGSAQIDKIRTLLQHADYLDWDSTETDPICRFSLCCVHVKWWLERQQAKTLVILGDNYEALAAATTAYLLNITIFHTREGEKPTDHGLWSAIAALEKHRVERPSPRD